MQQLHRGAGEDRESNTIVEQEIDGGGLSEATKANLVERLAVTIFIEARKREL